MRGTFEPPALIGRLERSRFGVITAGLAATTVKALLYRAAAEIESAGSSTARHTARVQFTVDPLSSSDDLDQLRAGDRNDALETHHWLKPVMLADC